MTQSNPTNQENPMYELLDLIQQQVSALRRLSESLPASVAPVPDPVPVPVPDHAPATVPAPPAAPGRTEGCHSGDPNRRTGTKR